MHRNVGVGELWKKWEILRALGADFQFGKTFKYYFQCRRADIFAVQRAVRPMRSCQAAEAGERYHSFTSLIWIVGFVFV